MTAQTTWLFRGGSSPLLTTSVGIRTASAHETETANESRAEIGTVTERGNEREKEIEKESERGSGGEREKESATGHQRNKSAHTLR